MRFLDKLLRLFMRHQGVPVEILKEMGIEAEDRQFVKDSVKRLRRQGYVIVATERVAGYTFLGWGPANEYTEVVTPTLGSASSRQTPTSPT